MEYVRVGEIVNTFGIRGELKVMSCTDFPEERFKKGSELHILYQNEYIPVTVLRYRQHKGMALLTFASLEDINLVEKYKGCELFVKKEYIKPLTDGSYYFFELMGCSVYSDNRCIGSVSSVEDGYQTLLRVDNGEKEVLIPYVDAFIKNVDIEAKRIDINVIEGLL